MKQQQCLKCSHFIPPERAGFCGSDAVPGVMKKNGRCAVSGRIVARMNDCPGRSEGVRERGSEEESRLKPAERPAKASGTNNSTRCVLVRTGDGARWEGLPVARYCCQKGHWCEFMLDIYTDGREYRGVFTISARQHTSTYGLSAILRTPAFRTEEECMAYYVKKALDHIDMNVNEMRPIDRDLRRWIIDNLDQMEIGL